MAKTSHKNEVWQSLCSNCISIAAFFLSTSRRISGSDACKSCPPWPRHACHISAPPARPSAGNQIHLMEEGKHYGCNRSCNKISVSPISTFLRIFAAAGKTLFYGTPCVSTLHEFLLSGGMTRCLMRWMSMTCRNIKPIVDLQNGKSPHPQKNWRKWLWKAKFLSLH